MSFKTFSPQTPAQALELLSLNGNYRPIAGGTNILVDLHQGKAAPSGLVDLSKLNEWKMIEVKGEVLEIGALVTHTEMEAHPVLLKYCPALNLAAASVGSPQIQNRGTLAGNLQSASPAADCAPPLMVYDAVLTLVSRSSTGQLQERQLPITEFFKGVGQTALQPNELISRVSLPLNICRQSLFLKSGLRKALAISMVNLAVNIELDRQNVCLNARISLGSVASTPVRAKESESFLVGHKLDIRTIEAASRYVQKAISPISDLRATAEYRRYLAQIMLQDALQRLSLANEEKQKGRKDDAYVGKND